MLTCLIVDDEPSAINILKVYVEKTPFLELVATAKDPLEAMQVMRDTSIDLMFLDVHMPHITGIDFLKMVKGKCQVVMTTAHSEFAVEGFEHEALDYLLKPIPFDRFLQAAQRALNQSVPIASPPSPPAPSAETTDNYMFVKTEVKGKVIKIDFKDILYVESRRNYVTIHKVDDSITTYGSISDLEEQLPGNFIRVQKSYIVSVDHIREVEGNQIFLQSLKPAVPLGDTYRRAFLQLLEDKMMGGKK